MIDHLIRLLPEVLSDDGVAYVMQLSIIGEQETIGTLGRAGYDSRVVDFALSSSASWRRRRAGRSNA